MQRGRLEAEICSEEALLSCIAATIQFWPCIC